LVCVRQSNGVACVALKGRKGYCCHDRTYVQTIVLIFNEFAL